MSYKVLVQDGHAFEVEENDPEALMYHESGDFHGGPHCLICGDYWCQHCTPEVFKEICKGRDTETLPGLEWDQPSPPPLIVARRI